MVPPAFMTFFATSASAGAALVGLLFVAVSIAPHETVKTSAPIERQATSASAFTALINAFFISLGALIPASNIGIFTLFMSVLGLLNTLTLTRHLVMPWPGLNGLVRRGPLVAAGLIIYGYEMYFAILLLITPDDKGPLYGLMGLLLGVYGLGIVRAWQLLGAKRFGFFGGFFDPFKGPDESQAHSKPDAVSEDG
ncbi:MAG TPA: hypothetical protein VKT82_34355 [Ktedonobacterales bacterium]|nr:hypothetical protein [Ktedonobacterales bacterium]